MRFNDYRNILLLIVGAFILRSCIRPEAPNSESDILSIRVPEMCGDGSYAQYRTGSERVTYSVSAVDAPLYVMEGSIEKLPETIFLSPEITVTPGATIEPASGTIREFSKENNYSVEYVVTSEDKKYHKKYTVTITELRGLRLFEHKRIFSFEGKTSIPAGVNEYDKIYEIIDDGITKKNDYFWETANAGFALVNKSEPREHYPTVSVEEGKEGRGILLQTVETGGLGKSVGMPIAGGNIFSGSFDIANAMAAPLEATNFGKITNERPISFHFWYKAKRGVQLTDKKMKPIKDQLDVPDAYAIFYVPKYTPDGNLIYLNGANSKTDDQIIALADAEATDFVVHGPDTNLDDVDWCEMEVFFKDQGNYTEQELTDVLKNNQVCVAILFTSSVNAHRFIGAVGSQMIVDEVTLYMEGANK